MGLVLSEGERGHGVVGEGERDYVIVVMATRPNYCRLKTFTRDCHSSSTCCCAELKRDLRQEEKASGIAALTEGVPEACGACTSRYRPRVHPTNTGGFYRPQVEPSAK